MKPNAPGLRRFALPMLLTVALAACGSAGESAPATAVEGLDTLVVEVGNAAPGRAWDGVVEAAREAVLSAQTSGRVAAVLHDVNDRVAAGDVLLRLTAVEQQAGADAARAALRAAEAAASEAEGNYRRYLELSQGRYVSKAQLDQMRMARDSAIAGRDAAHARLAHAGQQADYTTVRAPYAGIVSSRDVEPGESVGVGQRLMTVFSPGALRIEVGIPQAQAERLRADPRARVMFGDGRGVEVEPGAVTVFPSADPLTHAVKVRVRLPPLDPAPQPGGTAKVVFPALRGPAHPRIPASALVQRGEVNAVYVLADGRLSLRQLRLGERGDGGIDVIAGLRPDETIAADPVAAAQALAAARRGD